MDSPTETVPNVQQVVPMLGVASMDASLRFYVDGLGFEMTKHWLDDGVLRWCWLQLGGAALMLQEYRSERMPSGKLGEGVWLNFQCRDAIAFYHEAGARGIPAAKQPFVGNGMWVVEFTDPDGYQVFFESFTDVPEETEYAEG